MTATRASSRSKTPPALPITDVSQPAPPESAPAPDEAGEAFLDEARSLMAVGRMNDACEMISAALKVRPSVEAHRLMAVAAANTRKSKRADESVAALRADPDPDAASVTALAQVAVAQGSFQAADLLARQAVELDAHHADAWASLSASYAGLGWFDEADTCFQRATALGMSGHSRWTIGRAVNQWALGRTMAAITTGLLIPLFGLLAIAIGLTVPFVVREIRLTRLGDQFAVMAADAWAGQLRMRLLHGAAVFAVIALWVALTATM